LWGEKGGLEGERRRWGGAGNPTDKNTECN